MTKNSQIVEELQLEKFVSWLELSAFYFSFPIPFGVSMTDESFALYHLVKQDPRYPIEAYVFVREALAFAADSMELGSHPYDADMEDDERSQLARRTFCF